MHSVIPAHMSMWDNKHVHDFDWSNPVEVIAGGEWLLAYPCRGCQIVTTNRRR